MQEGSKRHGVPAGWKSDEVPPTAGRKQYRTLLILAAVFLGFLTVVFVFHKPRHINWVEDYQAGIELSRQQQKPLLLAFYKVHTRFCSDMEQNTYHNPGVVEYVDDNFVPLLIDVDKQPALAEQYNVRIYPSHYIKYPDSDKVYGPVMGFDPPELFSKKLKDLLKKVPKHP